MRKERDSGYGSCLESADWPSVRQQSHLPTCCSSAVKKHGERKVAKLCKQTFFFFLKFLAISFFFFSLSSLLFLLSHITVKSPPRCFQELALAHLCPLPPPSCTQVAPTNSSLRFKPRLRLLFCLWQEEVVAGWSLRGWLCG